MYQISVNLKNFRFRDQICQKTMNKKNFEIVNVKVKISIYNLPLDQISFNLPNVCFCGTKFSQRKSEFIYSWKNLFWRTSVNSCFWKYGHETEKNENWFKRNFNFTLKTCFLSISIRNKFMVGISWLVSHEDFFGVVRINSNY